MSISIILEVTSWKLTILVQRHLGRCLVSDCGDTEIEQSLDIASLYLFSVQHGILVFPRQTFDGTVQNARSFELLSWYVLEVHVVWVDTIRPSWRQSSWFTGLKIISAILGRVPVRHRILLFVVGMKPVDRYIKPKQY